MTLTNLLRTSRLTVAVAVGSLCITSITMSADLYPVYLKQFVIYKQGCEGHEELHNCMGMDFNNCQTTADSVVEECLQSTDSEKGPLHEIAKQGSETNVCMLSRFASAGYKRTTFMDCKKAINERHLIKFRANNFKPDDKSIKDSSPSIRNSSLAGKNDPEPPITLTLPPEWSVVPGWGRDPLNDIVSSFSGVTVWRWYLYRMSNLAAEKKIIEKYSLDENRSLYSPNDHEITRSPQWKALLAESSTRNLANIVINAESADVNPTLHTNLSSTEKMVSYLESTFEQKPEVFEVASMTFYRISINYDHDLYFVYSVPSELALTIQVYPNNSVHIDEVRNIITSIRML